ncbi:MAG: hypothetical protein ACK443_12445 [Methylococcaceae bacterium]|jgi:hypothetical protein
MDESIDDERWVAGFEGDRRIVVTRLGPYLRVFPRPENFTRRFYHRVYTLPIVDWQLELEPPQLGPLCTASARLAIRFQATYRYASEHVEHLDDLAAYIRTQYQSLLQDAAESELNALQTGEWLEHGQDRLAQRIEDLVHELLAIRNIQSRCRCVIDTRFHECDLAVVHADLCSTDLTRKRIALKILRRQHEITEHLTRNRHEGELQEQQLKLENQEKLLALMRRETELLQLRHQEELTQVRQAILSDETRHSENIDSRLRQQQEQLQHEAEYKRMGLAATLNEKAERATALNEVQAHLEREIELLAMERQRIALEEEINSIKQSRVRGWISGGSRSIAVRDSQ